VGQHFRIPRGGDFVTEEVGEGGDGLFGTYGGGGGCFTDYVVVSEGYADVLGDVDRVEYVGSCGGYGYL